MSIEFERELRAEMEQAPIRPRPDVVAVAYRRSRGRKLATRAALAAGTAVIASVAATIAVTGPPGQQRVETTAYVISQVNSALAAANNDVMYVSQGGVDYMNPSGTAFGTQYWGYGNQSRETTVFGGVEQDNWDTVTHVKQGLRDIEVSVGYKQRIAIKSTTIIPTTTVNQPFTCGGIPGGLLDSPGSGAIENASFIAGYMHTLLSCGDTTTSWNQRFDGTEAIKVTGHFGAVTWWVWIDRATFLPIADGFSSTVKTDGSGSDRYEWLPPTKASLADLTGPIPAGFKVVTYPVSTIAIPGPPTLSSTRPITPTTWGTGPAATIARRMAGSLTATSTKIYVSRQVITGSPSLTRASSSWIYPGKTRFQTSTDGRLASASLDTTTPVGHDQERDISILVDYPNRQVFRQDNVEPASKPWGNQLPTPAQVCAFAAGRADPVITWSGWGPTGEGITEAVVIRDLLACPNVTVTISSNQQFSGTRAIKIVWPRPGQHSTDTFWLNESTYALMGVTLASDPGYRDHVGHDVVDSSSTRMTWLPPTKANLALLAIDVPRGFAGGS